MSFRAACRGYDRPQGAFKQGGETESSENCEIINGRSTSTNEARAVKLCSPPYACTLAHFNSVELPALPKDDLFENSTMNFGEHLEELRGALAKAIICSGDRHVHFAGILCRQSDSLMCRRR